MNYRLLLSVLGLHLLFALAIYKPPAPVAKGEGKIVVRTKIVREEKIAVTAAPHKPKKTVVKPKSKPASKIGKAHELLKELESSMASMESALQKVQKTKPLSFESIAIEPLIEGPPSEESYFEMITMIFRESLTLPELGAVKLTITVQPNGEIVKIESVSIKSEENFRYLKTTLPHLQLPPPPTKDPLSITVTFCEEPG
jgi:hypothetical protein